MAWLCNDLTGFAYISANRWSVSRSLVNSKLHPVQIKQRDCGERERSKKETAWSDISHCNKIAVVLAIWSPTLFPSKVGSPRLHANFEHVTVSLFCIDISVESYRRKSCKIQNLNQPMNSEENKVYFIQTQQKVKEPAHSVFGQDYTGIRYAKNADMQD